jgi:hypothetical protein
MLMDGGCQATLKCAESLMASGRVPKTTSTRLLELDGKESELLVPVGDPSLGEVIGRHLQGDAIAG